MGPESHFGSKYLHALKVQGQGGMKEERERERTHMRVQEKGKFKI